MRLWLECMHEVWELDSVLNEVHRQVVADQVVVALRRVELDSKTAHITHRVGGTARTDGGRETHKDRRFNRRVLQKSRACELRQRLVEFEITVRPRAACVHHTLWNSLMVKVHELFAQDEVFHQARSVRPGLE